MKTSIKLFLALMILTGLIYPVIVWGVGQLLFSDQANGSLVRSGNTVVGSLLIAQQFESPAYFLPRPSAINYDGAGSGGSNIAPSNKELLNRIEKRIEQLKRRNPSSDPIPIDLVTTSGSGLDPHISLNSALWQAPGVAKEQNLPVEEVRKLIFDVAEQPLLGFIGEWRINVLKINMILDARRKQAR
jgi:K+-transporting ATPase ATPase C chain